MGAYYVLYDVSKHDLEFALLLLGAAKRTAQTSLRLQDIAKKRCR